MFIWRQVTVAGNNNVIMNINTQHDVIELVNPPDVRTLRHLVRARSNVLSKILLYMMAELQPGGSWSLPLYSRLCSGVCHPNPNAHHKKVRKREVGR